MIETSDPVERAALTAMTVQAVHWRMKFDASLATEIVNTLSRAFSGR